MADASEFCPFCGDRPQRAGAYWEVPCVHLDCTEFGARQFVSKAELVRAWKRRAESDAARVEVPHG